MVKGTSSGGRQWVSLQTMNSTIPSTVTCGLLKRIFCENFTSFLCQAICILKLGSKAPTALGLSVTPPTGAKPAPSNLKDVGIGPPSSINCEYTCHPRSIVADMTRVASFSLSSCASNDQSTGSYICALANKRKESKANKNRLFFMIA